MTYRVAVKGVWPNLQPSGNPDHVFDCPFDSEDEAREFFDAVSQPAELYWIDHRIGDISRKALAAK